MVKKFYTTPLIILIFSTMVVLAPKYPNSEYFIYVIEYQYVMLVITHFGHHNVLGASSPHADKGLIVMQYGLYRHAI